MNQDYTKENIHQQNKWIVATFFGNTRNVRTINTIQKHLEPKEERSNIRQWYT